MTELKLTEYMSAAALLAHGERMLRIEGPATFKGRCAMVFDNSSGSAERALIDHERDRLMLPSQTFALAVHSLKTRLFAMKREARP